MPLPQIKRTKYGFSTSQELMTLKLLLLKKPRVLKASVAIVLFQFMKLWGDFFQAYVAWLLQKAHFPVVCSMKIWKIHFAMSNLIFLPRFCVHKESNRWILDSLIKFDKKSSVRNDRWGVPKSLACWREELFKSLASMFIDEASTQINAGNGERLQN